MKGTQIVLHGFWGEGVSFSYINWCYSWNN